MLLIGFGSFFLGYDSFLGLIFVFSVEILNFVKFYYIFLILKGKESNWIEFKFEKYINLLKG